MLRKVTYAGARSPSFVEASRDLAALAEETVSRERVQRWTKRVGEECVTEAETLADEYQALPLPEQQKSPTDQVPQVACVMMDGGRIRDPQPSRGGARRQRLLERIAGRLLPQHGERRTTARSLPDHPQDVCRSRPDA